MRGTLLESDTGRGRSERGADAKQMLVGSQGEVGLLFMQALTDGRRTSPSCAVDEAFLSVWRERESSDCVPSWEIRHIIDRVEALKRIHSALSVLSSVSHLSSFLFDSSFCPCTEWKFSSSL